ncbi:MAG: glutamine amidotransferase subunit PdxT [Candidatus Solincola sediminis]|uniref:Pyridoxal 5'-phosphate synthase subunit PdxT n=1 Tax=Candidatus Solincola sediminis TaxID=1797199 RepID=A0A1F2WFP4_9ACTN|nr:MAG: glutamine amidotransferase subunit PdxT [Candidatus Solincola sediminis]
MKKPTIGVLALQGAFREHLQMIERIGARGIAIKYPAELHLCQGLVIPGGESTTIGKLMIEYGFLEGIRDLVREGMPVFGTCAGLIMLAKRLDEGDQPLLGLMDITVRRNAFGRQVDSFETELYLEGIEEADNPYKAVFIRAPWIEDTGPEVKVLGRFEGKPVIARQDGMLVCAFHPELTKDSRIHRHFLKMVNENHSVTAEKG